MLTVVHDAQSSNEDAGACRSLLDEIVRDGARQMLEAALKAEVAADDRRSWSASPHFLRAVVPQVPRAFEGHFTAEGS
jgi:hypothetical protein